MSQLPHASSTHARGACTCALCFVLKCCNILRPRDLSRILRVAWKHLMVREREKGVYKRKRKRKREREREGGKERKS